MELPEGPAGSVGPPEGPAVLPELLDDVAPVEELLDDPAGAEEPLEDPDGSALATGVKNNITPIATAAPVAVFLVILTINSPFIT